MSSPEQEVPLQDRPLNEVADTLQTVLGQEMTAYAICEKDPRKIGAFARSEAVPDEAAETTLRGIAEITGILLEEEGGSHEVVRALMLGANPLFNDRAVVEMFHNGRGERVIPWARQIGTHGAA